MPTIMPERSVPVAICSAGALVDGGRGVRFPVETGSGRATGFAIRFAGQVHGYLNRCAHAAVELDFDPGEFFDGRGLYLLCATHGALYAPDSGRCLDGPCRGQALRSLAVEERGGEIWWFPDAQMRAPST